MALQSLANLAREVTGSRAIESAVFFQLDHPSLLEIRTVSNKGTPILSRHLLDEVLGNASGYFDPRGRNYSQSARNAKVVNDSLVAELQTYDSTYRSAAIGLRVTQINSSQGLTHELTFGKSRRVNIVERAALGSQSAHSARLPPAALPNPRLKGKSLALLDHYSETAVGGRIQYVTHHYDLDTRIGNNDGAFTYGGQNFSQSARNIRLEGVVLMAELRTRSDEWKEDSLPLDWLMDGWCLQSGQAPPAHLAPTPPASQPSLPNLFRSYAPLPPISGQFRLCYIQPGAWHDAVHCTVVSQAMAQAERYRCLSYVWGDAENQELITLNSKEKLVTRRLFHALRQLRWHGVTGAVWIDALCINQNDDREKCIQVAQMGNVFSNADQVIVSLGKLGPPKRKSFMSCQHGAEFLPAMLFIFLRSIAQSKNITQAMKQAFTHCLIKFPEIKTDAHRMLPYLMESMIRFTDLSWFSRVWTTQEYTFARRAFFLCDYEVLEASLVHQAAHNIDLDKKIPGIVASWFNDKIFGNRDDQEYPRSALECSLYHSLVSLSYELIKLEMGTSRILGNMVNTSCRQAADIDGALLRLDLNRSRQCSDPRDKLFAFSNIAPALFQTFRPDYSLSSAAIYTSFTLGVIRRMGNLDLWHLAIPPAQDPLPELETLPSWVIDWSAPESYHTSLQYLSIQNTPSILPDFRSYGGVRLDASENHLIVRGYEFDKVLRITETAWATHSSHDTIDVSILLSWMDFIGLDMLGKANKKEVPGLWNQFWRLLVGDKFLIDVESGNTGLPVGLPGCPWLWRRPTRRDEKSVKAVVVEAQGHPEGIPTSRLSKQSHLIFNMMAVIAGQRRLFVSNQGLLGICPEWTQVDDLVFHVAGSRWPVILRPSPAASSEQGKRPTYRLVANCYVQAINADKVGEALKHGVDVHIV